MIEVPATRTPLTAEQASRAVLSAWDSIVGGTPDLDTFALVMALVWIETARGTSLITNNFGNISASEKFAGKAWRPPWFPEPTDTTSERNRHLHAEMLANRAPRAFRAYDSPEQGAIDYVRQLTRTFPEVVSAAGTGDVNAFREALSQKYSKDYARNPEAVNRNLGTFQTEFRGLGSGVGLSPKAPPSPNPARGPGQGEP